MLYFENDYCEGAHPAILQKLQETNFEKLPGYGMDPYCMSAKEKIRKACKCAHADIHFLMGGTQTNATVIRSFLRPYEGVIAAETGHISVHEAGAIEASGHKVLQLPQKDGKLSVSILKEYLKNFYEDENHDHMVFPGMIYLSHPTEYGTLYSRQELTDLSSICRQYHLPLYLDGARLGYGLAAKTTDVTLADIVSYTDVFSIGGTKIGALCGEAVVFPKKAPKHFVTQIKQQGALLAKGRLLGIQFDALFTEDLYITISKKAIKAAEKLKFALLEQGYRLFVDSPTNQLFVILENSKMEKLKKEVAFSFWEALDDSHTVVRFATSWATRDEDVQNLIHCLDSYKPI